MTLTLGSRQLDERGRCCGRKPIRYKGNKPHLFCDRCCAAYDPATEQQIDNWAWIAKPGGFEPTYPTHDYAVKVRVI